MYIRGKINKRVDSGYFWGVGIGEEIVGFFIGIVLSFVVILKFLNCIYWLL